MRVPPNLHAITHIQRRSPFGLHHVPFLVAYAITLQWCFRTVGDPLRLALAEKALKEASNAVALDSSGGGGGDESDNATSAMRAVVDVIVGASSADVGARTLVGGAADVGNTTLLAGAVNGTNSTADIDADATKKPIPLPNEACVSSSSSPPPPPPPPLSLPPSLAVTRP